MFVYNRIGAIRVLKNAPDCKGKKVSRIHKIQTGCGFMREIPEVCDINEEEEEEKIISTGTKQFKSNKTQFGTYKAMTFFQHFDNDTNSLPELYDEEKVNCFNLCGGINIMNCFRRMLVRRLKAFL